MFFVIIGMLLSECLKLDETVKDFFLLLLVGKKYTNRT